MPKITNMIKVSLLSTLLSVNTSQFDKGIVFNSQNIVAPVKNDDYFDVITDLYVYGAFLTKKGKEDFLNASFNDLNFEFGDWYSLLNADVKRASNFIGSGLTSFNIAKNFESNSFESLTPEMYRDFLNKFAPNTVSYLLEDVVLVEAKNLGGDAFFDIDNFNLFYRPNNRYLDMGKILHELGHKYDVKNRGIEFHYNNAPKSLADSVSIELIAELFRYKAIEEIKSTSPVFGNNIEKYYDFYAQNATNIHIKYAYLIAHRLESKDRYKLLDELLMSTDNLSSFVKNKIDIYETVNLDRDLQLKIIKKYSDLEKYYLTNQIDVDQIKSDFINSAKMYKNLHQTIDFEK